MADIDTILQKMRTSPTAIPFADLVRICTHHFGKPRHDGGSHKVFKMPWAGDPRINLQEEKGKGKAYQVRQALEAIDKLAAIQAKAAALTVAAPPAGPVKKASKAKNSKGKK